MFTNFDYFFAVHSRTADSRDANSAAMPGADHGRLVFIWPLVYNAS